MALQKVAERLLGNQISKVKISQFLQYPEFLIQRNVY